MADLLERLFSLEGKVALVTGGSRGIGRMIAASYASVGATVYISSRDPAACEATALELSALGPCTALPEDLSTEAGARRLTDRLTEMEEAVHILVNNAGATFRAPIEEYPDEALDLSWDLNVKGAFHLTRFLLPWLRKGATEDDPARIINVGSGAAITVPPVENYGYAASKAALHMLTRHLAHHLRRESIRVNALAPGVFDTNMTSAALHGEGRDEFVDMIPVGRVGTADDIGGAAIFLASRAGAYLTGAIVPVDGGWTTHG